MDRRVLVVAGLVLHLLPSCEGGCETHEECAPDEWCKGVVNACDPLCFEGLNETSDAEPRNGECVPRPGRGESCEDEGEGYPPCKVGLICHQLYSPTICLPPSPLGGPCGGEEDCEGYPAADQPRCTDHICAPR